MADLMKMLKQKYPYLKTDWECSSFPEGDWHSCCIEHDYGYATGENKWIADLKLLWCVLKKGHPLIAPIMYLGVTLGGWGPYLGYRKLRRDNGDTV